MKKSQLSFSTLLYLITINLELKKTITIANINLWLMMQESIELFVDLTNETRDKTRKYCTT